MNLGVAVCDAGTVTRATIFLARLPSDDPDMPDDLVCQAAEWLGTLDSAQTAAAPLSPADTAFAYEPPIPASRRIHGYDVLRDIRSAVLRVWKPKDGWRHLTVAASSAKKAFTGNGRATKEQMLAMGCSRFPQFMLAQQRSAEVHAGYSEHIADAIAIAEFAASRLEREAALGFSLTPVPRRRRRRGRAA